MDEPISGLDGRAAAIVMITARNRGRTVVCTIHPPSVDNFESFDKLLFMKRGGELIYAGPLPPILTSLVCSLRQLKEFLKSSLVLIQLHGCWRHNRDLVECLSKPNNESKNLSFPTKYSQPFSVQFLVSLWKQNKSYWRNLQYTAVHFFYTVIISLMFGTICWRFGSKRETQINVTIAMRVMYAAVLFIGIINATAVQPVVSTERLISYRERAAGMYSALSFAFAQVAIEFPSMFIQALIYGTMFYAMASFEWETMKFT